MKAQVLLTNILAVAAIAVIADTQSNGVTPFDNLRTKQEASFSATAGGSPADCEVTGGAATSTEGGYYVLNAKLSEGAPLTVTPRDVGLKEIEGFDVRFKASFVDEDEFSTLTSPSAPIGFALTGATTAKYFNGSSWNDLEVTPGVTEETEYTLHVDYDARDGEKARFSLDTTPAYTSAWVTVGAIALNSIAVHGSGSVKSLAGSTYKIIAEVVVITPEGETGSVDIDIPPKAMADIATKLGCDPAKPAEVAEKLNTKNEKNGLTELTNYILFGRVGPAIEAVDMPVAKGAPAATSGNVAVSVSGLDVQTNVGATVKYQLLGSTNNTDWHNVGEASTESKFEFTPESNGYRYFKVQAIIEY